MRMLPRGVARALLLALIGAVVAPLVAIGADRPTRPGDGIQNSVLQVPARGPFPMTMKIPLGVSKSMLVQFPFELKDVLVADPEKLELSCRPPTSLLIGKKVAYQAFFFDRRQAVLTLELAIGSD